MSNDVHGSGSCLLRLVWFLFGPAIMLILTIVNIDRGGGWFTGVDIAFFIALAITIAARWIDFGRGQSRTATGTLATIADLRRYVPLAIAAGILVWGIANFIGNR